jgi:hypothetical protein
MFTVSSDFIATFKIGDNINYNLGTLRVLYRCFEVSPPVDRTYLCKPITIALVSITEAMLYDFIERVKGPERVDTLPRDIIDGIKAKTYKKLDHYIASARKHDLFDADDGFYARLDELRKLRNRIHIQNEKKHFERNEGDAFSVTRKARAEEVLEYVCKYLSYKHTRSARGYVATFEFPWTPHYT